jgi:hypothetical protein
VQKKRRIWCSPPRKTRTVVRASWESRRRLTT